jgi:hypothetical protein
MEVYKAPQKYTSDNKFTIFLGGSIEQGKAEPWGDYLTSKLSTYNFDIRILNPRRDDYDAGQKQSIDNPYFKEQVTWELDGLDRADLIVMYLQPDTLSPISMMEIGLYINTLDWNKQMIICCPDGFWRRGNIEILVDRFPFHCRLVDSLQELEKMIIEKCSHLTIS